MDPNPAFFIADRLRGIPLVTSWQSNDQPKLGLQGLADRVNRNEAMTTKTSSKPSISTENPVRRHMMREIERRQVDQINLLTIPKRSEKKILKPVSVSTTKKPNVKQNNYNKQSKLTKQSSTSKSFTTSISTTTTSTTTTTTTSTSSPITTTKPINKAKITNNSLRSSSSSSSGIYNDPRLGVVYSDGIEEPILIGRQTILAPDHPDYQRRATQATISSKFSNRPNDFSSSNPGQNWILFNRPDGKFSIFELMVLLSNILIVATIVFVIIFSWIRSVKSEYRILSPIEKTYICRCAL